MTTTTFTVKGMTCGHCVAAVREELGRIDGVTDVDVDLDSGAVVLTSARPVPRDLVAAAVDEAGYELADG
jgi:copper chaperone